jgi:hypothetical protein
MIKSKITSKHIFIFYSLSIILLYLMGIINTVFNPFLLIPAIIFCYAKIISNIKGTENFSHPFSSFHYKLSDFIGAGASGLISLIVYALSASDGVPLLTYYKFAMDTFIYYARVVHPANYEPFYTPNYARYFLWTKIINYFDFSTVAFRIAFLSGLFGSLCIFLTYLIIAKCISAYQFHSDVPFARLLIPGLVSLSFAFSQLFWSQAVIPEVYTHNLMNLALVLFLLVNWSPQRRKLYLIVFNTLLMLLIDAHFSNLIFVLLISFYFIYQYRFVIHDRTYWFGMVLSAFILFGVIELNRMSQGVSSSIGPPLAYWSDYFQNKAPFLIDNLKSLYLLIKQQIGFIGIILVLGGFLLNLIRRSMFIGLLLAMIFSHISFFLMFYDAYDINVFYVPSIYLIFLLIPFVISSILQFHSTALRRVLVTENFKALKFVFLIIVACIPVILQLINNWDTNNMQALTSQENAFKLLNDTFSEEDAFFCHESIKPFCTNFQMYEIWINVESGIGERELEKRSLLIDYGEIDPSLIQLFLSQKNFNIYVFLPEPNINNYIRSDVWGDLIYIFDWPYPGRENQHIFLYKLVTVSPGKILFEDPFPEKETIFSFYHEWFKLVDVSMATQSYSNLNIIEVDLVWEINQVDNSNNTSYYALLDISTFAEPIDYYIAEGNYTRLLSDQMDQDQLWIIDTFQVVLSEKTKDIKITVDLPQ